MKIKIDDTLTFEFDSWCLSEASKAIEMIRDKHRDRTDSVLDGVLTLLVLGGVERQNPGTIGRLLNSATAVSKAMSKPVATA